MDEPRYWLDFKSTEPRGALLTFGLALIAVVVVLLGVCLGPDSWKDLRDRPTIRACDPPALVGKSIDEVKAQFGQPHRVFLDTSTLYYDWGSELWGTQQSLKLHYNEQREVVTAEWRFPDAYD